MTAYEELEVRLHTFLNSKLYASKWPASRISCLLPEKGLWYSMNRGMAGTQSWYEPGKEEKSPFLYWDIISVILSNSSCSPVAKPTDSPQHH
jgi:hypothetical protein